MFICAGKTENYLGEPAEENINFSVSKTEPQFLFLSTETYRQLHSVDKVGTYEKIILQNSLKKLHIIVCFVYKNLLSLS